MLSTEGTYPFHQGGVSTWCNVLVEKLKDIDYVVYSIIMNPFVTQKFSLPKNTGLIKVPLWGTEEPSEHLTTPFSQVYTAKRYTDKKVIYGDFLPLFKELIEEIIRWDKNPLKLGNTLLNLYKYFADYDYRNSFKSDLTWNVFKNTILEYTADSKNKMETPSVYDLIQSLGWIYRFLVILNTPLPPVDVTHSAAAAFCGIPCVLAKLEKKTPFLLTEHGVYLREQYLSLAGRRYSSYLNTFLVRMIHSVTNLNYAMADQISPVCNYNTRWEKAFGVSPKQIEVIYNGVDRDVFSPSSERLRNINPTVVAVARVDPVKDLISMIKAAAIVKEKIPDVKFVIYGSVSVPDYYEECLAIREELDLESTFIFAGHTTDVPAAYRSGDIIALSSVTEAFPYSIVEAMMTGKAIVATDVGGVREAVGGSGILVKPRHPEEFAQALIMLLEDSELRFTLGREARERALNLFTIEKALDLYSNSYRRLVGKHAKTSIPNLDTRRQKLMAERGYALAEMGYWQEAIVQFRKAVKIAPETAAVPVLIIEVARAYNNLGKYDLAFSELEKAEAWAEYMEKSKIA